MNIDKRKMHRCRCQDCVKPPYGQTVKKHRAMNNLLAGLDEKSRRQCVGALALDRGWGGISALHRITGLSRKTIQRGCDELLAPEAGASNRGVRRAGGGRPTVEKKHPTILKHLETLLQDETAGDPISGVKWTRKTLDQLADALKTR